MQHYTFCVVAVLGNALRILKTISTYCASLRSKCVRTRVRKIVRHYGISCCDNAAGSFVRQCRCCRRLHWFLPRGTEHSHCTLPWTDTGRHQELCWPTQTVSFLQHLILWFCWLFLIHYAVML